MPFPCRRGRASFGPLSCDEGVYSGENVVETLRVQGLVIFSKVVENTGSLEEAVDLLSGSRVPGGVHLNAK